MQPWEIARLDVSYPIRFFGHVESIPNSDKAHWTGGMECMAVAYDTPIPGFATKNCANIRLWKATPISGFDLNSFNGESPFADQIHADDAAGNYDASVSASSSVENIVKPLRHSKAGLTHSDTSAIPQR